MRRSRGKVRSLSIVKAGRVRIGILIQARMQSRSCPGKSLAPLGPRSVLGHVIRRCQTSALACGVAVATTTGESDDMLAEFCGYNGVRCFRGPETQVAQRLAWALNQLSWDACVRVLGDCPLIDPGLIDEGITRYVREGFDLVSTTRSGAYPAGQEIEVLRSALLCQRAPFLTHAADAEQVTSWFYRRLPAERVCHLTTAPWETHPGMRVTSPDDLERLREWSQQWGPALFDWSWREVLQHTSPSVANSEWRRRDEGVAA